MSKSFQMTGWRVGFAIGSAELIGALTKVKSYIDQVEFERDQLDSYVHQT